MPHILWAVAMVLIIALDLRLPAYKAHHPPFISTIRTFKTQIIELSKGLSIAETHLRDTSQRHIPYTFKSLLHNA
jgi:hypothetical protein